MTAIAHFRGPLPKGRMDELREARIQELLKLAAQQDPEAMRELCALSNTPVPAWAKKRS
tara:strand:- start:605 stop:781 length:177 start_codon:yes stop_codon:yes gene_type:complete